MMPKVHSEADFTLALQENLDYRKSLEGSINSALPLCVTSTDYRNKAAEFRFSAPAWTSNMSGFVHGGIIATIIDIAMSAVTLSYYENLRIPTIELSIKYLKSVPVEQELAVSVQIFEGGSRLVHANATILNPENADILASGTAMFYGLKNKTSPSNSTENIN